MQDITVKGLYKNSGKYLNQQITLIVWVRPLEVSKNFAFIEINDGTFFANPQFVLKTTLKIF